MNGVFRWQQRRHRKLILFYIVKIEMMLTNDDIFSSEKVIDKNHAVVCLLFAQWYRSRCVRHPPNQPVGISTLLLAFLISCLNKMYQLHKRYWKWLISDALTGNNGVDKFLSKKWQQFVHVFHSKFNSKPYTIANFESNQIYYESMAVLKWEHKKALCINYHRCTNAINELNVVK